MALIFGSLFFFVCVFLWFLVVFNVCLVAFNVFGGYDSDV